VENILAVSDLADRRVVELRLPWKMLSPLRPLTEKDIRLAVRVEDRDSPREIEPNSLSTWGEETRLVMVSDGAERIQGYLSLTLESVPVGEPLEGILFIDSPQPAAQAVLRLEISAPGDEKKERVAARISRDFQLEQGINSFRLYWNTSGQPEGDYLVRASASGAAGELFSLQSSFQIEKRRSIWKALPEYQERLSAPSVLKRLEKARGQSPAAPLKFAVLGDVRGGERIFAQLLKEAAAQGAEFAIVLGDLVGNGKAEEYLRLAELLKESPLPVLTTTGNHDFIGQGRLYYQHLFGPLNYSFDSGGCRFIILDNAMGRLTAAQLDWLEGQLQTPLPKFIFLHMPPSTIPKWAWHSFSEGADEFTALMEKYQPSRVFAAHIHAYDRANLNGVEYVLSGGAGAPLYPQLGPQAAVYHFLLVETGPQGISDSLTAMTWQKAPAKAAPQPAAAR
jgi:hypothetical protein